MTIKTFKIFFHSIAFAVMLFFAQSCCTSNVADNAKSSPVPLRELPMHYYIESHCKNLFGTKPPQAWQDYVEFCADVNDIMESSDDIADGYYGQPILPAAKTLWKTIDAEYYKKYFAKLLQCMALPELTDNQKACLEELALIHRQEWLINQLFESHDAMLHGAPRGILHFMMCASFYHIFRQNAGALAAEHADYDKLDAELEEWYALWRERKLMPASVQLPVLWKCSNGKKEIALRFAPVYTDLPSDMLFEEDTESYEMTCETEMPTNSGDVYLIFPAMPSQCNITVNDQVVTPPTPAHPFAYLLQGNASFIRITVTTTVRDSIGVPTLPICIGVVNANQQ